MISCFDLPIDLKEKVVGYISEKTLPPTTSTEVKVYIPLVMNKIKNWKTPKKTYMVNNTSSLFVNAKKCKPNASNKITVANYLTATLEDNNNVMRLITTSGGLSYIPQAKKVQCQFTHGKLSDITFNTDNFTK